MPLSPKHVATLERIKAEWNQAEIDVKLAEQVSTKVVWPAIKELRYAGRRVVEIIHLMHLDNGTLSDDDRAESDAQIQSILDDALFDCHRARHDSIDVATSKIFIDLEIYLRKLGYDAILPLYPNFPALWGRLQSVRDKITVSRENRHDRNAIYATIEAADFGVLVGEFNDLRKQEPFIAAMARRNKRQDFYGKWGFWVGVAGLLASAVTLPAALPKILNPPSESTSAANSQPIDAKPERTPSPPQPAKTAPR